MTHRLCTPALVARVEPRAAIFLEISDRSQTRSTACRHDEAQLLDHVLHPGGCLVVVVVDIFGKLPLTSAASSFQSSTWDGGISS